MATTWRQLLALVSAILAAGGGAGPAQAAASGPCGGAAAPAIRHVIWVVMENHALRDVVGTADTPRTTRIARTCALATDYHGIAHPSLPNYIALTTGSTHGIRTDCAPRECPVRGASVIAQAIRRGGARVYAESMPHPCWRSSARRYAPRHNPAVYLTSLSDATCRRIDRPLGPPATGPLARDLATARLAALTVVVPDLCSDTHDCGVATGDAWLGALVGRVTSSRAYRRRDVALVITWDEDDGGHDDPIGLLVVAPGVPPGLRIRRRADHYALLRTTEELLGLPLLGGARGATSLVGVLGLPPAR